MSCGVCFVTDSIEWYWLKLASALAAELFLSLTTSAPQSQLVANDEHDYLYCLHAHYIAIPPSYALYRQDALFAGGRSPLIPTKQPAWVRPQHIQS